ncbi:hypothetical protein [Aliikangiella sp. IMCC44359]|uniref:hypothetical protein n=1 Tax=Aliikangiella sp. IMCC44359 TaxID=3459125 RepID=UPI00403AB900
MPIVENIDPFIIVAVFAGLLSVYCFLSLLVKIKKLKAFAALQRLTVFLLLAAITSSASLLVVGTQGYQALTKEELVATINVTPTGEQGYHARMSFPDGSQQIFALKGDELMVDAYILKWKPWTNLLGLHTAYRLERVSGRYKELADERSKPRTVFAVNSRAGTGMAKWREDYEMLSFLLDVEHGSASFVNADSADTFNLLVTTNGLMIRPVEQSIN